MLALIFNYNLPIETDEIYNKLISDGFDEKKIIVVDNGSDKEKEAVSTNLSLPWNVRFTGQAYIALHYVLNFSSEDSFLLITTSAKLVEDVNYFDVFNRAITKVDNDYGFIGSGLSEGNTLADCPGQAYDENSLSLTPVFLFQPIVTLVSRKLLELCLESGSSYFNLELKRGWGVERELQFVANSNGIACYIDRSINVIWNSNRTHKKGLADESLDSYQNNAELEVARVFSKKYGLNWFNRFESEFYGVDQGVVYSRLFKNFLVRVGLIGFFRKIKSLKNFAIGDR